MPNRCEMLAVRSKSLLEERQWRHFFWEVIINGGYLSGTSTYITWHDICCSSRSQHWVPCDCRHIVALNVLRNLITRSTWNVWRHTLVCWICYQFTHKAKLTLSRKCAICEEDENNKFLKATQVLWSPSKVLTYIPHRTWVALITSEFAWFDAQDVQIYYIFKSLRDIKSVRAVSDGNVWENRPGA